VAQSSQGSADHDSVSFGFRSVLRDPSVFLMEIVWRWSFGALAFLLIFFGALALLGTLDVTTAHGAAWKSRDPFLITLAALRLLREIGWRPPFITLALGLTVLWVVFGALGRTVVLKRLSEKPDDLAFRYILGLQVWRAFFLWVGIAGATASIIFCAWVAMRGNAPDYLIFYVMAFPLLAALWVFCSVVNWYLSLAAICAEGHATTITVAIQRAMALARSQLAAVAGISLFFAALRVLALLFVFVLVAFSVSFMASAPRVLLGWLAFVVLAYCAFADFLYVCRLTCYVALKDSVLSALKM